MQQYEYWIFIKDINVHIILEKVQIIEVLLKNTHVTCNILKVNC